MAGKAAGSPAYWRYAGDRERGQAPAGPGQRKESSGTQGPQRSGFAARDMRLRSTSSGGTPSCTTATTCSTIATSTPWARASWRIDSHDFTPSATCRVLATISATLWPRPSFSPKVRFLDNGEEQVATRSPSPASPEKVYGSAPNAAPSRAVSASPLVISDAFALSPKPIPSAMPTAIAITFLTAPASSVPTTSVLVYGLKYGVWHSACTRAAPSSSAHAMTLAAGWRCATSPARFGPDSTATRAGGRPVTSRTTSLIRLVVP